MSNFIISDGSTSQTVDDGETITFADGVGAEFVTSATNTVTVNSVDSEIVHGNLSGLVANEHLDWTASVGTIHADNYTDTTYLVGDGGLTTNDFTNADHTKLNAIAASANNYTLPSASVTVVGGVELATTVETTTGTDTARAVTPAGAKAALDLKANLAGPTFTGTVAIPNISDLETAVTANTDKYTNVSTALSIGTVDATSYGITSDGGANDIVLPEATTSAAGLLGADKWDEIVANTAKTGITGGQASAITANTAKNTNVSTALSTGTVDATSYGITSDGGSDDIVLAQATTSVAGVLSAAKWDEIVANTAKNTNVATNLSKTVTSDAYSINSSDGDDIALSLADTDNWGLMSDEMFDKLGGIEASATADQTKADIDGLGIAALTVTQAAQTAITSAANLATVGTITTGVWEGTAIAIAQGGTGATSLDDLLDLDQLSDVSYGGTNLTKTLLINKGLGVAPAHGTLGSDCSHNFAVGDSCLQNMTGATDNVAIGNTALASNLTGDYNIAFGYRSLYSMAASSHNISMGYQSSFNATGSSNIAMGQDSLKGVYGAYNTSSHNIALGYRSLYGTTSGSSNVSIGQQSGAANSTGGKNIKLGYYAGTAATTESSMLYIANASESSNGTLIKGDMANKFLAIGKADVTLSTESSTLQVYPDGSTDVAYYAKMAGSHSADLIRIDDSTGAELFKVDSAGVATAGGFVGPLTGNAATATLATEATSITVSANNTADETVYPVFVDGATLTQEAETDTGLTYNPSSGKLTTGHVVTTGATALTGQTGAVTINALLGTYFTVAATGNITIDITGAVAGQKILIRIVYDDAHTLGFHANTTVIWPGGTEPSPTDTGIDVYGFLCTTGSTAFDGFIIGEALA
jgi:hypothetical protein